MIKPKSEIRAGVYGVAVDNVLHATGLTETQILDMLRAKAMPPPYFVDNRPYWSVQVIGQWLRLRQKVQKVNERAWAESLPIYPNLSTLMGLACKQAMDAGRARPEAMAPASL
jgi:hypothetical protein